MIVQHNMTAMNANRNLYTVSGQNRKSAEKLSSGYRINGAKDDAAGLTISEKMRWQVRGLNKASTNAQDGVALIQVAEGGMQEIQGSIQRMRELAVQSANDTNTAEDRSAIQSEINELSKEVDRIAQDTEYNEMKLLNGSTQLASVSASSGVITSTLGYTTTQQGIGSSSLTNTQRKNLADLLDKQIVPNIVNNLLSNYSAFSDLAGSNVGIGLKFVDGMSYAAYVSSSVSEAGGYKEFQLGVDLADIKFDGSGNITNSSRGQLEAVIAHEMIHAFMFEGDTYNMMNSGKDRFPMWLIEGMAQTASGDMGWMPNFSSASDSTIKGYIGNLTSNTNAANYGTGYLAAMYLGYELGGGSMSGILTGLNSFMSEVRDGTDPGGFDGIINSLSSGKYTSLADFEKKFKAGGADVVQFARDLSVAKAGGRGGLATGNLAATDLAADTNATSSVFDLDIDSAKVRNTYTGADYNFNSGISRSGGPLGALGSGGGAGGPFSTLQLQVGALEGQGILLEIPSVTSLDLGISFINVQTHEDAASAIDTCDDAIEYVSRARSTLGAYQNRLEHTISNLDNISENTQSAESRIRDTDMASEMVEYSKTNILSQASQSFLAQANQATQGVLSLLQ
jgi:flagellin